MIPLTSCRDALLVRKVSDSMTKTHEQELVIITEVYEHGANVTGLVATKLWRVSSAGGVACSWSVDDAVFRVFDDSINMSMGRKCHGTSLCSAGKSLCTYSSVNYEPSRTSTAKSSTIPNQTRMRGSPIWNCRKTTLSNLIRCLFALLSFIKSRYIICEDQVGFKKDLFIKFVPALVSLRHFIVIMLCAYTPTLSCVL